MAYKYNVIKYSCFKNLHSIIQPQNLIIHNSSQTYSEEGAWIIITGQHKFHNF